MVRIDGQYFYNIQIPETDYTTIVDAQTLISLTVEEFAGGRLPIFQLRFRLFQNEILQYLHEASKLVITFGKDEEESFISRFVILHREVTRPSDDYIELNVRGELDCIEYRTNSHTEIFENVSAVEVVFEIASKYFNIDTNIECSDERQDWYQVGISDYKMIIDTYLRGYIEGETCLGIAVSSTGNFVMKDILQRVNEKTYDWYIVDSNQLKENVDVLVCSPLYSIESRSGLTNLIKGYPTQVIDKDVEYMEQAVYPLEQLTSTAEEFERNPYVTNIVWKEYPINDNVHQYYNLAFSKNLSKLSLLSTIAITITFSNEIFFPIQPFDTVYFQSSSADTPYISGFYLVESVARNISETNLTTKVVLVREAFNMLVINENDESFQEDIPS